MRKPVGLSILLGVVVLIGVVVALSLGGGGGSDQASPSSLQAPAPPEATGSPPGDVAPVGTPAPETSERAPADESTAPAVTPPADVSSAPAETPPQHRLPAVSDTPDSGAIVAPDPNFQEELRRALFSTRGWETDFSRHTVPFNEIFSGGPPRDGIPPLDDPRFTTFEDADRWLGRLEPVIVFELNGDARAYPLQILTWHEVVNDVVGGVPVTVTFCPLCNSAIAFERTLDGRVLDFGTSGNLRHSDLVMWDRQTESWWQQLTGEAIVGELAGKRLTFLPSPIVSWEDFKASNPDGKVLSRDTGFSRPYGQNPYVGYDRVDNPPFLFFGDLDGRLQPKERVVTVTRGGEDAAFPFSVLERERVVNYTVGGEDVAVFFRPGTRSALGSVLIGDADEIGSTGVFETLLDGRKLTFRAEGDLFIDNETGSTWDILGQATSGPLAGAELTPIIHTNSFWFAIGAFKPDTRIFQGSMG